MVNARVPYISQVTVSNKFSPPLMMALQALSGVLLSLSAAAPAHAEMTSVCGALHHEYLQLPLNQSLNEWPALAILRARLRTPKWTKLEPQQYANVLKASEIGPWLVTHHNNPKRKSTIRGSVLPDANVSEDRGLRVLSLYETKDVPLKVVPGQITTVTVFKVAYRTNTDTTVGSPYKRVSRKSEYYGYVVANVPGWSDYLAPVGLYASSAEFVTDMFYLLAPNGQVFSLSAYDDDGRKVIVLDLVCETGRPVGGSL